MSAPPSMEVTRGAWLRAETTVEPSPRSIRASATVGLSTSESTMPCRVRRWPECSASAAGTRH